MRDLSEYRAGCAGIVIIAMVLLAILVIGGMDVAPAQEIVATAPVAPVPESEPSQWRPIWDALVTGIAGMIAVCIPLLTAVLMAWIRAKTGVSEAEQQRLLGPKLEAVFERARNWADLKLIETGVSPSPERRAELMAEYVRAQNPDLVAALRASDAQLYQGALARQANEPDAALARSHPP